MTQNHRAWVMIKKIIYVSAGSIILFILFIWLQFLLLPYYEAWKADAEVMSAKLWPHNVEEVCCTNGNSLFFYLNVDPKERKRNLRVINSNNQNRDISAPEGKRLLYCTHRSLTSEPLMVTWENIFDLEDIGRDRPKPIYRISLTELKDDFTKITDIVESNQEILVQDANDNWILGNVVKITGENSKISTICLISVKNKKIVEIPIKGRDVSAIAIVGNKVIYEETLLISSQSRHKLFLYSLLDRKEIEIGQTEDVRRDSWAFNGHMVAWSDHHFPDGECEIYSYDFNTNTTEKLLKGEGSKDYPFLFKEYIFWSEVKKSSSTGYDLFVKNIKTGNNKSIMITAGDQTHPVYFNGYIYWTNHIPSILSKIELFGNSQSYIFRKKIILP